MTIYLQRWTFDTYFAGERWIDVPLGTPEEEVRQRVETRYFGGNWKRDTLRKTGKVKQRKAKK